MYVSICACVMWSCLNMCVCTCVHKLVCVYKHVFVYYCVAGGLNVHPDFVWH